MYLLDTDHFGVLQLRDGDLHAALQTRMARRPRAEFAVSIISFHEQLNGWQAYLRKQRTADQVVYAYRRLENIIDDFTRWPIAPYNEEATHRFAELRKQGVRIGSMDLRIAAIALVRDDIVLTRNRVDFEKVQGLKIEDWTLPILEKPR